MEDFIVFDNVYGKKNAVRKSVIISVYEDEDTDDVVCISTNDESFETVENESYNCVNDFNEIIKELEK